MRCEIVGQPWENIDEAGLTAVKPAGRARDGFEALSLYGMAGGQALILSEIAQFGLSAQVARFTNPARDADFAALTDCPVATRTTESFFYFADHIFLIRMVPRQISSSILSTKRVRPRRAAASTTISRSPLSGGCKSR